MLQEIGEDPAVPMERGSESAPAPSPSEARLAKWLIRQQRLRRSHFADPQIDGAMWDMLLDLFVSAADGHDVPTTSLCLAASVPMSTAGRHVVALEGAGFVTRHIDPEDRRRVLVSLTPTARTKIADYLRKLERELRITGQPA